MEDSEYFSSELLETTEVVVGEKQMRGKDIWRVPEIPQQLPFVVFDDWFVLLNVAPRKTSYVPPGIAKHQVLFYKEPLLFYFVALVYKKGTLLLSLDSAHQLQ